MARIGALGLAMLCACGTGHELAAEGSSAALQSEALSAVQQLAREEMAAVQLAGAALQRPGLNRMFHDYVAIQQRLHAELLAQLGESEDLSALTMSSAGAAMRVELEGLDGAALAARYYTVQRPWQRRVLQQLHDWALPEAYRQSALQLWGRDLAALEALDR